MIKMFDTNVSIQLMDSAGVVYSGFVEVPAITDFGSMAMIILAVLVFFELLELIMHNRRI